MVESEYAPSRPQRRTALFEHVDGVGQMVEHLKQAARVEALRGNSPRRITSWTIAPSSSGGALATASALGSTPRTNSQASALRQLQEEPVSAADLEQRSELWRARLQPSEGATVGLEQGLGLVTVVEAARGVQLCDQIVASDRIGAHQATDIATHHPVVDTVGEAPGREDASAERPGSKVAGQRSLALPSQPHMAHLVARI